QHFLLALIIARGHGVLDLVRADVGDDALPGGDQLDELAVHLGQPPPQFFERHRGAAVGVRGWYRCTVAGARSGARAQVRAMVTRTFFAATRVSGAIFEARRTPRNPTRRKGWRIIRS